MLQGVIPAAFFATLLRRYLDSLSETADYSVPSSSSFGCLGASAAIATAGMAAYGLTRFTKNKKETNSSSINEITQPQKNDSRNRKLATRKQTREHRKKNKKWFLKHMKHYKAEYGRKIGKLMNQFLGVPLAEASGPEPIRLEGSEDDEPKVDSFCESSKFDNNTSKGFCNNEEHATAKNHFEDDDEDDKMADVGRKESSSSNLRRLLRSNFEMQIQKKLECGNSSESLQSISSTAIYEYGCDKRRRSSTKRSGSCCSTGERRRKRKPKTTRSGRCYNNSYS